ncbi:MAG: PAS domain S-box protein, partial [Chitinivibrionales bacterium]|nr:PAS domain S-box protein [Chitinivibrionales bacterium]
MVYWKHMKQRTVNTNISEVRFGEDKIIRGTITRHGSTITLEESRRFFEAAVRVSRGMRCPCIADIRNAGWITSEARRFLSGSEMSQAISSCAMIVDNTASRIIGSFFMSFFKPPFPVEIFTGEQDALSWINREHGGWGKGWKLREEWPSVILVATAWMLFIGIYCLLHDRVGGGFTALAVVPVTLAAWFWGFGAGIASGFISFFVNTALLNYSGTGGWDALVQNRGLPGIAALFIIAVIVAYLRSLRTKLIRELERRRDAEHAIKESEENFRRAFESSSEGLHLVSMEDGRFIAVNPSMCRMLGYSEQELLNRGPADLCAPEDQHKQQKALSILQTGGEIENHEGVRLKKDGSRMHALISAQNFLWHGKNVVYGAMRDITSIKEIQKKLQQKNKEIIEITNIVTHD